MKFIHRTLDLLAAFSLSLIAYPVGLLGFTLLMIIGFLVIMPSYHYITKGRLPNCIEVEEYNTFISGYLEYVLSFFGTVLTNIGPKFVEETQTDR